ncbi:MAG: hypothetical protein JSW73_00320 [Candidatus Woesearchaeota archaeon]|nr:MAG: hypothetical protein JSW73_00320 [Candidatus Woesearchaeota archaeon]
MEKDTRTWIIALLVIFIILLVGAFVIKPATTGYAVFREMSKSNLSMEDYEKGLEESKREISILNANLSACNSYNEALLSDVKNISKRFAVCNEELDTCENKLVKQKEDMEEYYNEIIQNVADSICCKERVDDSSIDSYSVKGGKIVCSSDGDKKINCVF